MPATPSTQVNGLTHKQKRFVWEFCKDHSPAAAAIRAGYREKNAPSVASRLIRIPAVQAAIRERERQIAEAALLDETIVLEGLLREARYTGDGSTHTARVSAWREVAKILGLEIRKVEHTVTHRLDGRLAQARQRAQLIEAQAAALPAPGDSVDMLAPAPAVQKAETAPVPEGVIDAEIIEDMPAARGESEPIPGGSGGRA